MSSSQDWVKVAARYGVESESSESRCLGAELSSELPGPCSKARATVPSEGQGMPLQGFFNNFQSWSEDAVREWRRRWSSSCFVTVFCGITDLHNRSNWRHMLHRDETPACQQTLYTLHFLLLSRFRLSSSSLSLAQPLPIPNPQLCLLF